MLELAELRVDLHFGRVLRMLLDDPSATIRQLAASALWEDEGADLPIRLLALAAEDPSQDVVAQAVQSLAATCDRAATGDVDESLARRLRDELLAIADDPGRAPTVRRRALEVAAVFADDARVAPLIEDFYDADEPGFRASAVYAMGRTADGRWRSRIVDEFVSDDAELRFEAARAAGELGDSEALPGLIELAGDEDPEVRQAAIGAMGRIGGRASLRALQRLAENAAESDADAIEDALLEAETTVDPLTVDR
jgi:HEAT repeat protein